MDINPFRYDFEEIMRERYYINRKGKITKSKNVFLSNKCKNSNKGD